MEVCIDGTTSYVVINTEGVIQAPDSVVEAVKAWIVEGNKPLPYYGGS
jgi:hypothetical protein